MFEYLLTLKKRPKPVFRECSSNLSAVNPGLSTDVPATLLRINSFHFEIRYDCMPGFTFPCKGKAKGISEIFPPQGHKNDITSSAQGGDASPAPSRHSLTHFTCAVDVSEDQHSGNTVATAVENRA